MILIEYSYERKTNEEEDEGCLRTVVVIVTSQTYTKNRHQTNLTK